MKSSLIRRASFFLLCLVCSIPAHAAMDLGYLKSLVDKRDFKTAYSYAIKHLEENEGDPEFDYLFGMAAIDTGEISKGIFSLERVLIVQPNNHPARLELARAYFLLGEDVRARQEFETILKKNPPPGVQVTIKQFINAIRLRESRYRTTERTYAELSIGYDANVNSGTVYDSYISSHSLPFSLSNSALQKDSPFYKVTVGGVVNKPVAPGEFFTMGGDFSFRGNKNPDTHEFDTRTFTGYANGTIYYEDNKKLRIGGQIQMAYLGDQPSSNTLGLNAEWQYSFDKNTYFTATLSSSRTRHPLQTKLDAKSWLSSFGFTKRLSTISKPVYFASILIGKDDAWREYGIAGVEDKAAADKRIYGFQAGTQFLLTPKLSLSASALIQRTTYGAKNRSFLGHPVRADDYFQASLSSKWVFLEDWSLRADINFIENDSSIRINSYDRIEGQLSVRHDFQ